METEFVYATLLCIFLYLYWLYFLGINSSRNEKNNDSNETGRQILKPVPVVSLLRHLLPTMLFDKTRPTQLLQRVGKLGLIIDVRFWKMRVTVINDIKLGKEMFRNPVFCHRPDEEMVTFYAKGQYGVAFSNGTRWREQRRFCHQHLKQFGFGTRSMEALVNDELDDLLANWSDKNGSTFSPNKEFNIPIISSLWMILAGERVSAENKELTDHALSVYGCFKQSLRIPDTFVFAIPMETGYLSKIASWFPIFTKFKYFQDRVLELREYFERVVKSRKETLDAGEIPKDLVDAYLKEIRRTKDPESEFFGEKGEMHLIATMIDFFIAGGDTTANTIAWAMLHLIRNPSVQEKIWNEIQTIVGTDRRPSLIDRVRCPFTEAFLMETLRMNPLAASSTPHISSEDASIGPYFVPKGTVLTINVYSIHHDPKIWGDPETFRPERFLSPDGKSIVRHEAMCEFSVGLRRCVGEQVARDNLFLFITAICQRFILKPDPILKELPPLRGIKSIIHAPDTFKMVAIDRLKTQG